MPIARLRPPRPAVPFHRERSRPSGASSRAYIFPIDGGRSLEELLVPAVVPEYGWTWTEGQSLADAEERIQLVTEFGGAPAIRILAHPGFGTREVRIAERSGARMKRLACSCCDGVTFSWRRVSRVVRLSSQPLKESASGSGISESRK